MTFRFPDMVPDPQVQIDLRDPAEIARAEDREAYDLWALLDQCLAEVEAEQAAWAEEKRLRSLFHGEPPKPAVCNLRVEFDEDPYLAEDRALRAFETEDGDSDDPDENGYLTEQKWDEEDDPEPVHEKDDPDPDEESGGE